MGYGAKGDRIWGNALGPLNLKGKTSKRKRSNAEKVRRYGASFPLKSGAEVSP